MINQASSHRDIKLNRGACIARVVGSCNHGVCIEKGLHDLIKPSHSIVEIVSVAGVSILLWAVESSLIALELLSKKMVCVDQGITMAL